MELSSKKLTMLTSLHEELSRRTVVPDIAREESLNLLFSPFSETHANLGVQCS